MGRGKIEIKKIENINSRQVTFSKRRAGLLKKAKELSILCDAEVAVIVFSGTGRLYEFASSSMERVLAKYNKVPTTAESPAKVEIIAAEPQVLKHDLQPEVNALRAELANMHKLHCRMMGKDLEGLNFKELQHLEHQLTEGILTVKDTKEQVLFEQLEKSRLQEEKIKLENQVLREQIEELRGSSRPYLPEKKNFLASLSAMCDCRSKREGNSDKSNVP
ncbi:PREDICTED: MADS-box transcription factor 23-like isoform X2 [Ipomoea nil]|uniref:MADS-box transcription factor 23-like isoform X2 n=1 Tax=Ipomoea nil TaxID=35883 RepID=UPI0009014999|nr:PREDICTED: MADS-box transcription factor 23-like isoform X2 [Ipomoea nil]